MRGHETDESFGLRHGLPSGLVSEIPEKDLRAGRGPGTSGTDDPGDLRGVRHRDSGMEIEEEHIHLLVSFPPSRSIGEVVRIIKSKSGRGLFREFPGLKKRLWGGELWEDGYFARTVGDRMTRDVIARVYRASSRTRARACAA